MVNVAFEVKVFKPQEMNIKGVRLELLGALRSEVKPTTRLFRQIWKTWKGEKPGTKSEVNLTTRAASLTVEAFGSEMALNKFKWLNSGTRIRWAIMSRDWHSKTRPGRLQSGAGRGRVVVAGRKHMKRPQPGIDARNWLEEIIKLRGKPFIIAMIQAKNRGVAKIYD